MSFHLNEMARFDQTVTKKNQMTRWQAGPSFNEVHVTTPSV
jgi:hypothetical protein